MGATGIEEEEEDDDDDDDNDDTLTTILWIHSTTHSPGSPSINNHIQNNTATYVNRITKCTSQRW
jgi:hypothetical protein